jgi:UDPglucose--hexose-1-phosphate uridylyltransferase
MEFPKTVIAAQLLSPPSFERDTHSIEYREDPLTGMLCRINTRRAGRIRKAPPPDLSEIMAESSDCPFCPQNIEQATPLFTEDFYPEGRIRQGDCYLFPNLFPLTEYHATGTLTPRHFLDLDQFQVEMVVDSLRATKEYLLWVHRQNKEARYPIYLWNHLPPSAASILHPHVQVLVDRRPTSYQQRLLQSSKDYFLKTGRNFWRDLIEEEKKKGERCIREKGSVAVIASYAPQGNREVQIIFREISNLAELSEPGIVDFAECVIKLLCGYKQIGVNSFNLSTFSAPLGERLGYYSLHAKLISRPVLQPFYRNDTGILERLHYEADIEIEPEVVAKELRVLFEGDL